MAETIASIKPARSLRVIFPVVFSNGALSTLSHEPCCDLETMLKQKVELQVDNGSLVYSLTSLIGCAISEYFD